MNHLPLAVDGSNNDGSSFKESSTCCQVHSKLSDKQQIFTNNEIKEFGSIVAKCKHKNEFTCAQFYEEKIRSMLEIFSEVIEALLYILIEKIKSRRVYRNLSQSVGELVSSLILVVIPYIYHVINNI